ncbi:LuxR C-terminal-related transcriptional regulator [Amycolatopsis sp. NPDC059657]|uniref:helix-turn-helix transcriptional regulator n=1 Tax=Amycolatopsis sp. NPDC059657 TaxID=3346899 RepID=UPI00367338D0
MTVVIPQRTGFLSSVTTEVIAMTTERAAPHTLAALTDNFRNGVTYRILVPDRARFTTAVSARLSMLSLAGASVRTLPTIPADTMVLDGSIAVVPGSPSGFAVLDLPDIAATALELFARIWRTAAPFPSSPPAELTTRERELLVLLSAGCTDEAAAIRLEVSVRTIRRTVADIMSRLGARSRFQAGAKAADRGWLVDC